MCDVFYVVSLSFCEDYLPSCSENAVPGITEPHATKASPNKNATRGSNLEISVTYALNYWTMQRWCGRLPSSGRGRVAPATTSSMKVSCCSLGRLGSSYGSRSSSPFFLMTSMMSGIDAASLLEDWS